MAEDFTPPLHLWIAADYRPVLMRDGLEWTVERTVHFVDRHGNADQEITLLPGHAADALEAAMSAEKLNQAWRARNVR